MFLFSRSQSHPQTEPSGRVCWFLGQRVPEELEGLFFVSQQEAESTEVETGSGVRTPHTAGILELQLSSKQWTIIVHSERTLTGL